MVVRRLPTAQLAPKADRTLSRKFYPPAYPLSSHPVCVYAPCVLLPFFSLLFLPFHTLPPPSPGGASGNPGAVHLITAPRRNFPLTAIRAPPGAESVLCWLGHDREAHHPGSSSRSAAPGRPAAMRRVASADLVEPLKAHRRWLEGGTRAAAGFISRAVISPTSRFRERFSVGPS